MTLWTLPARLLCLWNSPGKNSGVGCQALLQGIFLTQRFFQPMSLMSPALAGGFFTTSATWEARRASWKAAKPGSELSFSWFQNPCYFSPGYTIRSSPQPHAGPQGSRGSRHLKTPHSLASWLMGLLCGNDVNDVKGDP